MSGRRKRAEASMRRALHRTLQIKGLPKRAVRALQEASRKESSVTIEVVAKSGYYRITATVPTPQEMRVYRNRTRLAATDSLTTVGWCGHLDEGDVIEAAGGLDAPTLTVVAGEEKQDEDQHDPRDHAAHV